MELTNKFTCKTTKLGVDRSNCAQQCAVPLRITWTNPKTYTVTLELIRQQSSKRISSKQSGITCLILLHQLLSNRSKEPHIHTRTLFCKNTRHLHSRWNHRIDKYIALNSGIFPLELKIPKSILVYKKSAVFRIHHQKNL